MLPQVLGPPTLIDADGVHHRLRPLEAVAAAFLCLSAKCNRAELAGILWPNAGASKSQHSLNQLLYTFKRRYNLTVLSEPRAVSLPGVSSDITLLRHDLDDGRYSDALLRVRGPFLEGVDVPKGKATSWRDEIDTYVTTIVSGAVTAALTISSRVELRSLCDICEDVLTRFPYLHDERKLLIQALHTSGDPARARRHYNELRASVEFDEPLATFDELVGSTKYRPLTTDQGEHVGTQARFVGREQELAALMEAWRQTQNGMGATRIVSGEPGIGKTRFSLHFLRRVAIAGGRTWMARCTAGAQRLPFSAIKGLLEDAGIDASAAKPEIGFLLHPSSTEYRPPVSNDYLTHVLVEALTNLVISHAAQRPLAILIDDAQWADDFTAMLLAYWSYRLKASRVLILATVRTHDVEPTPNWLQNELTGAKTLGLGPLSNAEAAELLNNVEVANALDLTPDRKRAVLQKCGGVPFLLIEQVRTADNSRPNEGLDGASSTGDLLSRRFRQLSPECGWLVGCLAVVGEPITSSELAQWSGLTDLEAAAALDTLQTRGIIRCDNGKVAFAHDLMRDMAYRQLGTVTRSILHHRVASLLSSFDGREGIAAQHYAAAGEADSCGNLALAAADAALRKHLYGDAEFYYRLVLSNGPERLFPEAAQQLLRLLLQMGRIADGEDLIPLIPASLDDPSVRMLKAVATLEQELVRGATSTDLLERAVAVSRMTDAIRLAGLATIGTSLLDIAMDASAIELGKEVVNALEAVADDDADPEFAIQTQALAATWEVITHSHVVASARLRRLSRFKHLELSNPTRGLIGSATALAAFYGGDLLRALEIYEESIKHAETAGDLRRLYVLRANWGVVCMELARMDDARRAFEMAATSPKLPFRMRAYQNLSLLHYEQSDYVLAKQAADAVLVHNNIYEAPALEASARAIHGLCALSKGDNAGAKGQFMAIRNTSINLTAALNDNSYILTFLARMQSAAGDGHGAVEMLKEGVLAKRDIDVPCSLRLECEVARIMATYDSSAAYALAKEVLALSQQHGAVLIADNAKQVLAICRLSR